MGRTRKDRLPLLCLAVVLGACSEDIRPARGTAGAGRISLLQELTGQSLHSMPSPASAARRHGNLEIPAQALHNPGAVPTAPWGLSFWTNGSVFFDVELGDGGGEIVLHCKGQSSGGTQARVTLLRRGHGIQARHAPEEWGEMRFRIWRSGKQRFEIRFDNDYDMAGADRGFDLAKVTVTNAVLPDLTRHYGDLARRLHCPDYPAVPAEAQRWLVQLSLNGDTRPGLFAPAPSEYRFPLEVPEGAVLELGGGMPAGEALKPGDGVGFVVEVVEGESRTRLLQDYLNPKRTGTDGSWRDWRLPLDRWAGRRVELVLATHPGDPAGQGEPDADYDAAVWSNPTVQSSQAADPRPSFVLISMDTLRADSTGSYGNPRPTTPHLDRLARRSTVFQRCLSSAPFTLPSHMSLFTSLAPSAHGYLDWNRPIPGGAAELTLAEALRDSGYRTRAFVDLGMLSPILRVNQGFEHYDDSGESVEPVLRKGARWLRDRGPEGAPFLLFLHTYRVHSPYEAPRALRQAMDPDYTGATNGSEETLRQLRALAFRPGWLTAGSDELRSLNPPIESRDLEHIQRLYEAGILDADRHLGAILDALDETGLRDDTYLVFLSDHGEEFGEHEAFANHNVSLHVELLHVPLLISGPRAAPGRVAPENAGLLDVMPTVLELAGVRIRPAGLAGRSLLPSLSGSVQRDEPILAERVLRDGSWERAVSSQSAKFIEEKGVGRLYDPMRDPGERRPVTPGDAREIEASRERLHALLGRKRASEPEAASSPEVDERLLETLRALGYVE